jgi:hypothetical protein
MLKGIKRAICMIVVVAIVMICTPCAVYANTEFAAQSVSVRIGKDDGGVLYSMKGKQASKELRYTLSDLGVEVNDGSTIAVISSGIEEGTHAVQVTNVEGSLITTHKLVAINDNGSVGRVNALSERAVTETDVMGDTTELLNGGLVFIWAVQFDYRSSGFGLDLFRPLYMQIYYRNTGGHNVEKMEMLGACTGNEYTYPGLVMISSADYYHEMLISETAPDKNKYYINTNAYRSDRMIGNSVGFGGYVIYLSYIVNGEEYEDMGDVTVFVRSPQ